MLEKSKNVKERFLPEEKQFMIQKKSEIDSEENEDEEDEETLLFYCSNILHLFEELLLTAP